MKAAGESILDSSDELSEEELKMVAGGDPTMLAAVAFVVGTVAALYAVLIFWVAMKGRAKAPK